jgi:mercuric ion transport protein
MPSPTRRPRPGPDGPSGAGLTAAGIGAALLVIVCCAGPVVLAAGALATIGAWLANPWVIAAGAALLIAALALVVRRRGEGKNACHPPAFEEEPYRR